MKQSAVFSFMGAGLGGRLVILGMCRCRSSKTTTPNKTAIVPVSWERKRNESKALTKDIATPIFCSDRRQESDSVPFYALAIAVSRIPAFGVRTPSQCSRWRSDE